MNKALKKLVLSEARNIPFDKLVLSQSNVRQVKKGLSIEQLAESILQRTLLQSLSVRPVVDDDGTESGQYHVPAGGRRYLALKHLVDTKQMAKTAAVPCVVRLDGIAEDDSFAENDQRIGLHPLDQFRAFKALRDKGLSEEEIAARHFVSVDIVRQRLRLTTVSPMLLDLYVEEQITYGQLTAFSIVQDHARQEQVWDIMSRGHGYLREPYHIRRMLTETAVEADDFRVVFVGIDAYERAGGAVTRDLFQQDGGGWLQDVGLLDSLALEKLNAAAQEVAAEGWKWVEIAPQFPYGAYPEARHLKGAVIPPTSEEEAQNQALTEELERLEAAHSDFGILPDDVAARFEEINQALVALDDRPLVYDPAEKAIAGALVSIDDDGQLSVERGIVRPEDEPADDAGEEQDADAAASDQDDRAAEPEIRRAIITIGGGSAAPALDEAAEEEVIKPLPDVLRLELSAARTVALQNAVANDPDVAMTLLLHTLCRAAFSHDRFGGCLEAGVNDVQFVVQGPDLKSTAAAKAIKERHASWKSALPGDEEALWQHLVQLGAADRASLLAHLVAIGVNAIDENVKYDNGRVSAHGVKRRLQGADRLARAVGLDMVTEGWQPTYDNYLSRVTKPRILAAVREAKGEHTAQLIDHLKKGDMAREAERLLAGSGWLPEPLRLEPAEASAAPEEQGEALPEFLVGDEDDGEPEDAELPMAAE